MEWKGVQKKFFSSLFFLFFFFFNNISILNTPGGLPLSPNPLTISGIDSGGRRIYKRPEAAVTPCYLVLWDWRGQGPVSICKQQTEDEKARRGRACLLDHEKWLLCVSAFWVRWDPAPEEPASDNN